MIYLLCLSTNCMIPIQQNVGIHCDCNNFLCRTVASLIEHSQCIYASHWAHLYPLDHCPYKTNIEPKKQHHEHHKNESQLQSLEHAEAGMVYGALTWKILVRWF